jgi:dephospho-CoA kinase
LGSNGFFSQGAPVPVIAITGGLGSGKSTVREIFEKLGAAGIDADQLAREVVQPGTEGAEKVREAFGGDCFNRQGRLDRRKLGSAVFSDKAALRKLESILHPLIREAESRLIAEHLQREPGRLVVVEIPLLTEGGRASAYDGIILVTAPEKVRLERLVGSGRYNHREARERMRFQVSDSERLNLAHWTVDNGGTTKQTKMQVETIYRELKSRHEIPC